MAWITPSELFTPVYGSAIASFILQHHAAHASGEPLSIVEVGGGNGTLAKDIMVSTAGARGARALVLTCRHPLEIAVRRLS